MKLLKIFLAAMFGILTLAAGQVAFYKEKSNNKFVEGAAFVNTKDALALVFKLTKDAPQDFSLNNIYMYTDQDRKTGRKNLGNEYYFDIAKEQISAYAKNGKGSLFRNALKEVKKDNFYMVIFNENVTTANPLKEFEIIFNGAKKRGNIILRGNAPLKVEIPEIPSFSKKATTSAKKVTPKKSSPKSSNKKVAVTQKPAVSSNGVQIFLAPSVTKLTNQSDNTNIKNLKVKALRNAYEDFQLAVYFGKKDRGTLRLYWGDIVDKNGKKLPNSKIEFFNLVKVPFSEPIDPKTKRNIKVSSKEPLLQKMIFDRLSPYSQGAKAGDYKLYLAKTFTVWYARAYFPGNTVPGKYTVNFKVVYPGGEEKLSVEFDVKSFVVPARTNFVMFADLPRLINYTSKRFETEIGYPNGMTLNLDECLQDMSNHRIALRSLPAKVKLSFDKNEKPILDFSNFDPLAKYVLDDLKMNTRMEMPLATVSTGHSSNYTKLYGPIDSTQISDEFRRKYTATLRAVQNHLKKNNWHKYFFAYFSDEPARSDFGQMAEVARIIKAADKDLVPWIYGPGPRAEFMDVLDTWMGGFGTPLEEGEIQANESGKIVTKAIARGDRIGVYNPHTAYTLNGTATLTRTLYWWAYQQNLYWMSMYCLGYFTSGPQDLTNRRYWHYWVYPPFPGKSTCWDSSIRWEATRDGMTDYELLFAAEKAIEKLKKQIPAATKLNSKAVSLEYANAVSKARENRCEDFNVFSKVRDALITEVETLNQAINNKTFAFAHYKFDKSNVNLEVYAPNNSSVKIIAKNKVLHQGKISSNKPFVYTMNKKDAIGNEFEIVINNNLKLKKTIFAPFSK